MNKVWQVAVREFVAGHAPDGQYPADWNRRLAAAGYVAPHWPAPWGLDASPGEQLAYYQAVIDKMGRKAVDDFARLFVMPQTGHGLSGNSYGVDGDGKTITPAPIPNRYDQWGLLFDWVEKKTAPPMSVELTAGERSLPLCSYPAHPQYVKGPVTAAASYRCAQ